MVARLLKTKSWKNAVSDKDIAALQLFQSSKKILMEIEPRVSKDPDRILKLMCELLQEKGKALHYQKAAEFYFAHMAAVSQETVNDLNAAAIEKKVHSVVNILAPYVTENNDEKKERICFSTEDINEIDVNPIEPFCYENFAPFAINKFLKKIGVKDTVFENVKYKDSDIIAPIFVVECAVVPYMEQLIERPTYIRRYKKDYSEFKINPVADKVADALDQESFQTVLDKLVGKDLPAFEEVIIPYGRFASGTQITALCSRFKEWGNWDGYASKGRQAIIIANGAILLNNSREALMYADELGILNAAAEIRNTTGDVLRDRFISDFKFDADGKRCYNLGKTTVAVLLDNDLNLELYDVTKEKTIKTLPKAGNDPPKIFAANKEICETKRNIKNVIKNRVSALKKDYLNERVRAARDWKATYMVNPILKKIAEHIVWIANDREAGKTVSFVLRNDGSTVDAYAHPVMISDSADISVAHPMSMSREEVINWKNYLNANFIEQPFAQMFEPVYCGDINSLQDRYLGNEVPFSLIKDLEKEGMEITGNREYGFELRYGYSMSLELNIYDRNVYSVKMIPLKTNVVLGNFSVNERSITKSLNHMLFLLDRICFGYIK